MKRFMEFITESKDIFFGFTFKGEEVIFKKNTKKEIFIDVLDWLENLGYKFENNTGQYNFPRILDTIPKESRPSHYYKIDSINKYVDINFIKEFQSLKSLLLDFGIKSDTINFKISTEKSTDTDNIEDVPNEEVMSVSKSIKSPEKSKNYVKNPFGCKQEDGTETSTLCILGKSGSGKTTTTENALESMGHEVLLYIPIEGEYTFSQYTGSSFEMSSLGEFVMTAQNNPNRYYTVIIDECHRPITLSKLNTDLLQALSSRRNRNGQRFFTMDRSTKRMYVTPSEEFPIPLKEQIGKILVPDNFGIVCLSSNPSVISRNDDFLNRVDIAIFRKSDRDIEDLTELQKLTSKDTNTIRGILDSDGIN